MRRRVTCRAVPYWDRVPVSPQHFRCNGVPISTSADIVAIQKELDRQGVRYE